MDDYARPENGRSVARRRATFQGFEPGCGSIHFEYVDFGSKRTSAYVADTSKKIHAVKHSNALAGKCSCRLPYGYRALNGSNQEWKIDEYAAEIVREVFKRFIAGDGTHTMAKDFDRRGIVSPLVYYRRLKGLPPLNENTTWFTYF